MSSDTLESRVYAFFLIVRTLLVVVMLLNPPVALTAASTGTAEMENVHRATKLAKNEREVPVLLGIEQSPPSPLKRDASDTFELREKVTTMLPWDMNRTCTWAARTFRRQRGRPDRIPGTGMGRILKKRVHHDCLYW